MSKRDCLVYQAEINTLTLIFFFSYFNIILSACRNNSLRVASNFRVMKTYFCAMITLFLVLALMWNEKGGTNATQSE